MLPRFETRKTQGRLRSKIVTKFRTFSAPLCKIVLKFEGILWCIMGVAIKAQTYMYWRDVGSDRQVAMLRS